MEDRNKLRLIFKQDGEKKVFFLSPQEWREITGNKEPEPSVALPGPDGFPYVDDWVSARCGI